MKLKPMHNLAEYSLIGNSRSAALLSRHGAIDWCCLPEFHAPAIFSALLDRQRGGHFSISPVEQYHSVQRYIADTNVVETVFTTRGGQVRLLDAFVAATEEEKTHALFPDHEILRVVQNVRGTVPLKMEFAPTLYYGSRAPGLRNRKKLGIRFAAKENVFTLLSTLDEGQISLAQNKATALFRLGSGQEAVFSLSCSSQSPSVLPEIKTTGWRRMEQTIRFWKNWMKQCTYTGLYAEQVKRSALVLKLLAHAPSGAIIAAPTTSLPEEIGGERNWDYRYCWLRDASFTVRALLKLGFEQEAQAYVNWMLHATRLTQPRLQVVYSVYGNTRLKEQQLHWLDGFEHSKPVRIGNGAAKQFQLDVYGEVIDAFFAYSAIVPELDRSSKNFLLGLGKVICRLWNTPDNGIWELRSSPAHHTHSKVMAWVGLDRLVGLARKYHWKKAGIEEFERTKALLRQNIERLGYNRAIQSYTRVFNESSVDASSLVFPLVGYCQASSPKMRATVRRICSELSQNNLLYRYRAADGLGGSEGCFGICSFWLAANLAKAGRLKEAVQVFEAVVKHAGPSGLLSEEIDPVSGRLLGNYPQGFTHIGLINAALTINEACKNGGTVA